MRIKKTIKTIFFTMLIFGVSSFQFPFDASAETRPYYGWTRTIGGTGTEQGQAETVDINGNLYIAGNFNSSNLEFNTTGAGSSDIKSTAGLQDIFTTKYNSDGSYAWTRIIGGTTTDQALTITNDIYGNIYVAGSFASTNVEFNTTGAGSSDIHSSAGSQDMFITKYNTDGSYGWTRIIGGTGTDQAVEIATDNNGNIFFVGQFSTTSLEFNTTGGGASDVHTSNGSSDIFITKYNSNGSYGWTRTIGGTGADAGSTVNIDNNGSIYFAGRIASANIEFNTTGAGSSDIKSTNGGNDIFITKYNNDNSYGWTRSAGGTSNDSVDSLTTNSAGEIYFTGRYLSTSVEFNTTGAGSSDVKSNAGGADIFITKYTDNGSYNWTRTIGGLATEIPSSISTDNNGNIYVAGQFASTNVEFNTTGAGNSDIKSTTGLSDAFIIKYYNTDNYAWAKTIGGTTGSEVPQEITTDDDGNVYTIGQFASSNIEFNTTGFGPSDIKSTAGGTDIFITKLTSIEIEVSLLESGVNSNGNISVNEGSNGSYEVILNAEPSDDVTIIFSHGSGITVSLSTLTFTPSNWNTPQTVTVSATNDGIVSGNRSVTISHTVTSNDSLYNGISVPDMTVNIVEDDIQTTSTGKKASSGAGVGLGNGTDVEVELEVESEEKSEITITPTPTKTVKPTDLPETGNKGNIKGEGIKFTTVALCSLPLIIVVIIMIIAAKRKKKNEN